MSVGRVCFSPSYVNVGCMNDAGRTIELGSEYKVLNGCTARVFNKGLRMVAVKKIVQFMTLLCAGSILCLSGCGGAAGGDATGETVFVYVLNGYPGSSKLTLYGPTGKLASGLPFGQRTEEAVVLDRNTNSNQFVLMIDGAPT